MCNVLVLVIITGPCGLNFIHYTNSYLSRCLSYMYMFGSEYCVFQVARIFDINSAVLIINSCVPMLCAILCAVSELNA